VWILQLFYNISGNYGLALVLFAVLVKVLLFPLSLKGKRSMIQMNMLAGQQQKLQKMYGRNQEKYQMELQKLYDKEHVNPMSGCLWTLLPVLVIFPLYAIIRQPLTYMMNLTVDEIGALLPVVNQFASAPITATGDAYYQLTAAEVLAQNFQAIAANADVAAFAGKLQTINFDLLGINLASVPKPMFWEGGVSWNSVGLFLLPVISAGLGLLFSIVSMRTNAINQQAAQAANSSSRMMLIISPLMSLWIGFIMPGGLSVYWIANNLLSMLQEFIASKLLKKDYEKARIEQARREAEEKEEAKRLKEEARLERARRLEEEKKNRGKKKSAPRKKEEEPAGVNKDASRVGLRAYARGRAYDPYRFSPDGPTPYRDSAFTVDDDAVEKALEKKAEEQEKAAFAEKYQLTEEDLQEVEQAAQAAVAEETAPDAGETAEEAPAGDEADKPRFETPKYDAPDYSGKEADDSADDDAEEL